MSLKIHTDVEILIWQKREVTVPTDPNERRIVTFSNLFPRFLKFGIARQGSTTLIWKARRTNFVDYGELRGLSLDPGDTFDLFTAHLLTINNLNAENRDGYSNSLLSAPVVRETLPSLTSAMTSFGGISISIADPALRRFFDGNDVQTTTQNPVRVYRSVCGKRSLVWSGFMDGIAINATHQTTLNCRPLLKKFDQLATFGFGDKARRWESTNFLLPVIACKLMPWSVQHAEHSPVGTETHSFLSNTGPQGSILQLSNWGTDIGKLEFINNRAIQPQKQYADDLTLSMLEPYVKPASARTRLTLDQDRELDKKREEVNRLGTEHLEAAKRPRYVSFNKSELTRSIVSIDKDTYKVTFERGIMFAPTTSVTEARNFLRPTLRNYEHSLIPEGAQLQDRTFTSAPHYQRFLIGMRDLRLFDSPYQKIRTSYVKSGLNIMGSYPLTTSAADISYARKGNVRFKGFDHFSLFPSLRLGDNYCNWTHIPVRLPSNVTSLYRDYIGAQDFPPLEGEALTRPIVRYVRSNYSDVIIDPKGGFFAYDRVPSEVPPHPLDSFFRTTQIAPDSADGRFSGSNDGYIRWTMYTPHGVSLSYFGRKQGYDIIEDPDDIVDREPRVIDYGYLKTEDLLVPEYYFFTQYTTFLTYADSSSYSAQETELRNHHARIFQGAGTSFAINYRRYRQTVPGGGTAIDDATTLDIYYPIVQSISKLSQQTSFLQNGINEIAMPRSKDMYSTEESFERDQDIQETGSLSINYPDNLIIWATAIKVDPKWQSLASSSLRVMPAHPTPTRYSNHPFESIYQNNFPVMSVETRNDSGAYYTSATYDPVNEVGYWDISKDLNPSAHVNASKNFMGYYHHHQADGRGVSPYNFLYSIVKSLNFDPDWEIDDTTYSEMTAENPMQFIGNTGQSYKSFVDRTCPCLGKALRWNPNKNKMEIIDWLSAHHSSDRDIKVLYDENCLLFEGMSASSVSIPSSIIFENPDILRGENTLEGFSEENKLLGRYSRLTSNLFIQGKSVMVQTATWNEDAKRGLALYDKIADILSYRVSIVSFTVGNEVLLGYGELGSLAVGNWVRLVSPAFVQGVADLFITETNASELTTQFKAYKFQGVGIQDIEDNDVALGAPPESEADIPGDSRAPDDRGIPFDVENRIYY